MVSVLGSFVDLNGPVLILICSLNLNIMSVNYKRLIRIIVESLQSFYDAENISRMKWNTLRVPKEENVRQSFVRLWCLCIYLKEKSDSSLKHPVCRLREFVYLAGLKSNVFCQRISFERSNREQPRRWLPSLIQMRMM
jgi:hypothetical protein